MYYRDNEENTDDLNMKVDGRHMEGLGEGRGRGQAKKHTDLYGVAARWVQKKTCLRGPGGGGGRRKGNEDWPEEEAG